MRYRERITRALPVVAVLTLAIGALAGRAWGAPPPPSSAPASAALAGSTASPVKGSDIPADASPRPSESEWSSARSITASRGTLAKTCSMVLVREWVRVTCTGSPGVGLVAGDPKSARVGAVPSDDVTKLVAMIDLPIRRGAASIVSFLGIEEGYNAASTSEGPVLQIGWRDGMPDPLIIAR